MPNTCCSPQRLLRTANTFGSRSTLANGRSVCVSTQPLAKQSPACQSTHFSPEIAPSFAQMSCRCLLVDECSSTRDPAFSLGPGDLFKRDHWTTGILTCLPNCDHHTMPETILDVEPMHMDTCIRCMCLGEPPINAVSLKAASYHIKRV